MRMTIHYLSKIGFCGQRTRLLLPHLILFPLFAFPSTGAVDKIVFPGGMQEVNFAECWELTGTAESGYE